jgi:hypothetical protein
MRAVKTRPWLCVEARWIHQYEDKEWLEGVGASGTAEDQQ